MSTAPIDAPSATAPAAGPQITAFNQGDGPHFSDLLDILNPLQHIPLINTLYQHLTGDTEGAVADVAGGTLWTGPIGLVGSLLDLAVRNDSGKSIGDTVLGWLGLEGDTAPDTALAGTDSPAAAPSGPAASTEQAKQVAALPPPVLTEALAPILVKPVPDKARKTDEKTPDPVRRDGEYLVFGAAGSGQPQSLARAQPADPQTTTKTAAPTARGAYMVFGGDQPAATTPAPVAPSLPSAGGSPAPANAQLAASGGRVFAVPQRRPEQLVPTILPPPSTGPAAIPGHGPSQALPPENQSWFVDAVAAGLTKYQAAQKLTQNSADDDNTTLH